MYKALRLNIKRRGKRRLPARIKAPLVVPERPNQVWSADFMSDALWSGRRFRTFNVMDDFNPRIAAHRNRYEPAGTTRCAGTRSTHRDPRQADRLRLDNGPELISEALAKWANKNSVKLPFIQPGRPMQNGFIERFNRTYRQEVLNCYVFETLGEVRRMTEDWQRRYNEERRTSRSATSPHANT